MQKTNYNQTKKAKGFIQHQKFHKNVNPGRPFIIIIGCQASNTSQHVKYHLQPTAKQILFYVKDTNGLTNKIKDYNIPKDSIPASLDVKSLTTSMPEDAIQKS